MAAEAIGLFYIFQCVAVFYSLLESIICFNCGLISSNNSPFGFKMQIISLFKNPVSFIEAPDKLFMTAKYGYDI